MEGYAAVAYSVLIADDHGDMRQLVAELLKAEGYDVREAADTQGVLDGVRGTKPDLLILDVNMPGAGGVEALREIRRDPELEGIRVLLLSGSIDLAAGWPEELGADAHLPKPFPIEELKSAVRDLLAG
jgi:CheY-like chemotaxis protein